MKHIVKELIKRVKKQFKFILFFALFFIIAGYLLPYTYYKYIDKTEYVIYNSVTSTKEEYKACDNISLAVNRDALETVTGTVTLVLYKRNDGGLIYQRHAFDATLKKGHRELVDNALPPLSCNLEPGEYFFQGTLLYRIDRIVKSTFFTTNVFRIN